MTVNVALIKMIVKQLFENGTIDLSGSFEQIKTINLDQTEKSEIASLTRSILEDGGIKIKLEDEILDIVTSLTKNPSELRKIITLLEGSLTLTIKSSADENKSQTSIQIDSKIAGENKSKAPSFSINLSVKDRNVREIFDVILHQVKLFPGIKSIFEEPLNTVALLENKEIASSSIFAKRLLELEIDNLPFEQKVEKARSFLYDEETGLATKLINKKFKGQVKIQFGKNANISIKTNYSNNN